VKAFRLNLLGALVAGSMLLLNGGAAKADTVNFTLTEGGNTETFTLPLSPTPNLVGSDFFTLENVPVLLDGVSNTDTFDFLDAAEGGGLNDADIPDGGLGIFHIVTNQQLFSGTLTDPTFVPGTYTDGFGDFITITETPLPAALPLFAAGLSAMGFAGWRRKRKAPAA
jgi:hypothetical protein